ncbi:PKD domain-containing protein [Bacillus sp. S3]|uniref:PKD domain-containing protein n=1 Tax=Bacillus sp. S3 TaxID=486398 RepID=UPI001681804A|nr:PKD domain-containing protein [Bacillus sp. S3]
MNSYINPFLNTIQHVQAAVANGWEQKSDGSWYYYVNSKAVTGWYSVGGKWYFFDMNTGAMKTGWLSDKGYWYYLDSVNGDMKTGWQFITGEWYYLNTSGVMQTGWIFLDSRWYYLHDSGTMASDEWVTDDSGEPYFFTPSGGYKKWSTLPGGRKSYSFESGAKLVYDVYSKTYSGKGYNIETRNGKPSIVFKGWAIIFGHKTHTASNNSTYIVAQNTKNPKKIFGYNTTKQNWSATEDVEYNKSLSTATTVWNQCPSSTTNTNNSVCNMLYDYVGFEVAIPLSDLFPEPTTPDEWKLYIVKRVDDTVLWDTLILPFNLASQNYSQGKIDLKSEVDATTLRMIGTNVYKRTTPNTTNGTGYFITGQDYTAIDSNEDNTAVWYGVNDPVTSSKRWSSSVYWLFGGSQAVIKYTPAFKPPVANFDVSPNPLFNDTLATFTNKSTDPQGYKLTYQWWYMKPGTSNWVEFSSAKDPSMVLNQKGNWRIFLRATNEKGMFNDIEKTVTVQNRAPIADFIWTPSTIFYDTNVAFTNTSTDPDGDPLTYKWEYQQPGSSTWTSFSTTKDTNRIFNIQGDWNIRLTVSDGTASHSVTKVLTVGNRPPIANFSFSPTTIYNDTTVTFTNSSTDPDGDALTYKWEYQQPGSSTWTSFSTAKDPSQVFNIKGDWNIRLTVSDGTASHSITKILTVGNRPPIANFSFSPTTIYNDTTVTFTNSSADPDGDALTYKWEYQQPGSSTWTSFSTAKDPSQVFNIKGDWNIRLTVSDGTASHSVTKNLTVGNRPPIANFSFSPTTIYNDTTVTFTNSSADPDGDALTYKWEYQQPGSSTWTSFSTAKDPSQVFNIKGDWNIRLTVSDGTASHSVTKNLTVDNRPPVANFSFNPTTIYNDTTVTFTNSSMDLDGDSLTYKWEYQQPGSSIWTSFSTTKDTSKLFNIKGNWNIRLTASDGTASHSVTKVLTVGNRSPVANFSYSPATIYNDTTVTFTNSSTDPDGDPLTYSWEYQQPGSSTWTSFSTAKDTSKLFNIKGNWNIRLTASDGIVSHSVIKVLPVGNRSPIANFSYSPTTIYNDTTVTFTNSSTDSDGDILTYNWEYQQPGSLTWTSFSTAKDPSRIFNIKGDWNIRLTASDGIVSHSVTKVLPVGNRSPIANFSFNPTTIYNDTTVTFTNSSTDPDGDILTYKWEYQQPGSLTWTSFSTAKDPSRIFNIQGDWNIRLTVSDGTASHSVTKVLTVGNRPPIANFSFSPSTIYNDTTVTFTNSSTDPDGDALTYKWEYQQPGSSTWTSFSTAKDTSRIFNIKGDWDIRLTVSDGAASHSVTNKLTVQNRPPIADFIWSPTTIFNDTNVTFANKSIDSDGDVLTYKWEYQQPGSLTWTSFSTAKDPSRTFNIKGDWNIRLTVSDGTASHSVTNKLMVQNRPPIADFIWSPTTIFNDTNVTFANKSIDSDGDVLTYKWEYQQPGSLTWTSFSTAKDPSRTFNIKGDWNIRLTVSDGTASHSVTKVLTVGNRPPIANFSFSPTTIYNDTTVTFTNSSTDLDGDPLTYKWEYQQPGSTTWTSFSTTNAPNKVFNVKGNWNIRLTASDGTASHSVTKVLTVGNRPPSPGFNTNKDSYIVNEQVNITSNAFDPDNDPITYNYVVIKPDGQKLTFNTANPSFTASIIGVYTITQTVTDPYNESSSVSKTIKVINTVPSITLTYNPDQPFEGDTVNICVKVKDPDGQKLDVKLFIKEEGSIEILVMTKLQVLTDTEHCYSFVTKSKKYEIRATVLDGYDSAETTTWFYSKALTIKGHVDHTPEWLSKHQSLGNSPEQFYSGEKFLLAADTSPYPIVYVKSTLKASQADGQSIVRTVDLSKLANVLFKGELYDENFLNYPTNIQKGPASFEFEVKYSNGIIKKDTVPIEIVDNVLEVYRFHRKY